MAIYERFLGADAKDKKAEEGLAVARLRTAQLKLELGLNRGAESVAKRSFADSQALNRQDPSNRLWQEIAIKAANVRAEALIMNGDRAEARTVNDWALDRATKLVAADATVPEWRTDCLMPARWMQVAMSRGAGDSAAASRQIAAFDRDFTWKPANKPTDEERFAWIAVDMLGGANWRAAGQQSKAHASFARAAGRLPAGTADRRPAARRRNLPSKSFEKVLACLRIRSRDGRPGSIQSGGIARQSKGMRNA